MNEPKINEKRMQAFAERFEKEILPIIIGEDDKGLDRFRAIVEEKRNAVEERKRLREQNVTNEGGDV